MDVRPISGLFSEPRPVPLRDETRAEVVPSVGQDPAAPDLGNTEWVRPMERSADLQAFTEHLAEAVNEALRNMKYSLQFVVEAKDRSLTVRVLDSEGEVIREIPPEEIRSMQQRLLEMVGILFDEKEG